MERTAKFTPEKTKFAMHELRDKWILSSDQNSISITYDCASFSKAILLVNAVAHFAEKIDHHPGIQIDYKRVTFSLSSHDVGGLSGRDFELARHIEALNLKPAGGSQLQ